MVLACKGCGKNVPPQEWKKGVCIECAATASCASLRNELVRLYHKRARYSKTSASLKAMDEQAGRVRQRIVREVQKLTTDPKRVEEIVNKQGQLATENAMTRTRIHLPIWGRR